MIVENMIEHFLASIMAVFSLVDVVGLPLDAIDALSTIMCYGVWVVGADILALFAGSVVAVWSGKLTVGLVVWLYEHVPFIN